MGLPMNVENLEAESLEKNTLVQRRIIIQTWQDLNIKVPHIKRIWHHKSLCKKKRDTLVSVLKFLNNFLFV